MSRAEGALLSKLTSCLVVTAAAAILQGCVAAAALPFAAGIALGQTQGARDEGPSPPSSVASASARSDLGIEVTPLTALPAPDARAAYGNPAVSAFTSYAIAQADLPPGTAKRESAILASASELRPARAGCGRQPLAVFIDLDPGRGTFDPLAPGEANEALGTALAALRERRVRVVWFSRLGANFSDAARAALVAGGLDPAGRDELVLMRGIDERKQSLRDDAAKRLCPVAMLGDERADFDELYLYLKNPDSALALDALIGKGWFLASPFVPGTTPQPGAMP